MANQHEPMLEMFIFETTQILEQLEQVVLSNEKSKGYSKENINEVFRHMHTIKGSSAMMFFENISSLAHSIEDIFYVLREENNCDYDCVLLSDLILESIDLIKLELEKIKNGDNADGDSSYLIKELQRFLSFINGKDTKVEKIVPKEQEQHYYIQKKEEAYSHSYKARVYFDEGCEMENIRAYTIIHNLKDITQSIYHVPENVIEDENSIDVIKNQGFTIYFKTNQSYQEIYDFFIQTIFLRTLELEEVEGREVDQYFIVQPKVEECLPSFEMEQKNKLIEKEKKAIQHSMISVNVDKLDKLMDLVGEMVIAEAMVTQNPDLKGLQLDNFQKAARLLDKITSDLQDMVMSIRMVPLANTFHKMKRIVRDMNKKLGKQVELEVVGEETEVDKNIIEHISDPLMHLVRNAIDHGIEDSELRLEKGKPRNGRLILEAKNAGSDVLVIVRDDGKGLDKEIILEKASRNNLLTKSPEEMTDKEIYSLIFLPGFSTKSNVTEFSGRGVGMDVVAKNIESIGGYVTVDSLLDKGTVITIKIPLTLAIIEGMNIKVGKSRYTVPINSIKESFKASENQIIKDPDGVEMIMVRGQCYPIIRLHEVYKVKPITTDITDGILLMIENEGNSICLFADELLGQQQVVVKALPTYISKIKKIKGIAGCTLLGDGNISLIMDVTTLV